MVHSTTASLPQILASYRELVEEALRRYVDFGDGCPERLADAVRYSLLGPGKRLRPILVLMAAEACGGSAAAAVPAAAAVEMVHAYSLIHDDLPAMDDDDLRRGQPTCHKRFDEATAILAGDALLSLAFEVLCRDVHPPEVAVRCGRLLAEAAGARGMVGGQADDVAGSIGSDREALESIHRRKTGAIISASLRLGATVAGATAVQCEALARYGRSLGLAFQITDDLLDVRGAEAKVGKRVGKDSDRGKLTFPGLLGVEESIRRAQRLIEAACEAIAPFGLRGECLEALARYVLERNR